MTISPDIETKEENLNPKPHDDYLDSAMEEESRSGGEDLLDVA